MDHHNSTEFFIRGTSPFARLVFFATMSLILMASDSRFHYMTEIRQGFVALLQPIQTVANSPSLLYYESSKYLVTHTTLVKENQMLKQKALFQDVQLQRLNSLDTENAHLRDLLSATKSLTQPGQLAEIVHMGRDPFTHKVIVNLGARQNIVPGQAVVDGAGVIGQVTRVYPFTSEVTLVTDKNLAIPIQIERNGLRAIAFGHGRDTTIDLPYLPANVDIKRGDKLVTSGIDGVYPTGLVVGEVVLTESNPNSPFAHIVSRPTAGIENHRQVLLLAIQAVSSTDYLPDNPTSKPSASKSGSANVEKKHHATH
jgi:rod shape-determining protein MreC